MLKKAEESFSMDCKYVGEWCNGVANIKENWKRKPIMWTVYLNDFTIKVHMGKTNMYSYNIIAAEMWFPALGIWTTLDS